mmetsp:Transcript_2514/g.6929  ORF Transcript_2514/g.6929 Transcript_2514/m.6929 type:complete len:335 (+) Transcript_2514:36-1040(+)
MYNIASDPIQQNSLLLESSLRTNDEPGQVAGALVILSLHKFPPRPKADACLEDKLRGVDGHVNPAAQGESNPTFSCYWRQKGEDLFLGGLGPEAPTLGRVVKLETEFHSPEFRPHLFVLRRKPPLRSHLHLLVQYLFQGVRFPPPLVGISLEPLLIRYLDLGDDPLALVRGVLEMDADSVSPRPARLQARLQHRCRILRSTEPPRPCGIRPVTQHSLILPLVLLVRFQHHRGLLQDLQVEALASIRRHQPPRHVVQPSAIRKFTCGFPPSLGHHMDLPVVQTPPPLPVCFWQVQMTQLNRVSIGVELGEPSSPLPRSMLLKGIPQNTVASPAAA